MVPPVNGLSCARVGMGRDPDNDMSGDGLTCGLGVLESSTPAYSAGGFRLVTAMGDDRSNLVQVGSEFEEIELEELDESTELFTGEFARPTLAARSSSGRGSAPPPLPAQARQVRGSSPPDRTLRPPPPAGGVTIPPLPIPRPARSSGAFRIDPTGRTPPLPIAAADYAAPDENQLSAIRNELRELRAHNDRLRLTVRLRDDRIRELEQIARELRTRADALVAQLAKAHEQEPADDLKRIRGIGPSYERALHENGVTSFAQIADWTREDIERIALRLRTAPARILRGGWVERARELAGKVGG
jgi:predicted flap endonuclease-1-like 5' DNA nuclease